MKTQEETLETLTFEEHDGIETLQAISSMRRLKILELGMVYSIGSSETEVATVQQNRSVENLSFYNNLINSKETNGLLNIFPQVKVLKIVRLNDEIADFISQTCKSLKRLYVERFCAKSISDEKFYFNLEELNSKYCGDLICGNLLKKLNRK